jgi:RNA polymerase sigma-70 factor (ECF subfamily)
VENAMIIFVTHDSCDSSSSEASYREERVRDDDATDETLVRRALDRPGGAAASTLFARYHGRVYVWCRRYVRDHEDALDLAQDVLFKAYDSLGSFRGNSRFSSWLFSITRNRCLSSLRAAKRYREEDIEPDDLPGAGLGPDEAIEGAEAEAELLGLIRRELGPEEQEALWLRCVEKMPVDEITKTLRIAGASGARGVLQSARRKLRSALGKRREEEGE